MMDVSDPKVNAARKLLRRIALLETALWYIRIKWPEDRARQAVIVDKVADLRTQLGVVRDA